MNHKEALEAACGTMAQFPPYHVASSQAMEAAITAYLAARDCVVMPRELDDDLASVGAVANDFISLYGVKNIYIALIAEIDRREREAGK